jgi:uncharacterized protein YyaL (SSP411 family)
MYHFNDGEPHLPNQLIDQAEAARALCYAYECTGEERFLKLARELMTIAVEKLYDREHGAFFDTIADPNAPGFLSKPTKPLDENSSTVRALTKLYHLTGEENYRKLAEGTLERFVEVYPQFGFMGAEYALAIDAFLNDATIVRIVGDIAAPGTKGLLAEAHKTYEPRRIVQVLDPNLNADLIIALGFPLPKQPTAYVCLGRICTAPIIEPRQIAIELQNVSAKRISK